MERLPYKECETCRDRNGNINKCHLCTEKCPQEELACEIAKGRMYATNEMIKLQKAYDKMARYLEEDSRRNCVVCNRKTGSYRAWSYKDGIEIKVPVCHECEGKIGMCLHSTMDIHLKGIRESITHSMIITYDEKCLQEIQLERRRNEGSI